MKKSVQGREHSEQTDHEGVSSSVWLRYGEMLRKEWAKGDGGNGRRRWLLPLSWPETLYSSSKCQPSFISEKLSLSSSSWSWGFPAPYCVSLLGLPHWTTRTPILLTLSPLCAKHSAWKMGCKQEARVRPSNMQGQGGKKNKTPQGTQVWSVTVTRTIPNSGLVLVKTDHLTENTNW